MQEDNLKEIVENILNREWTESEKIKSGYFDDYNNILKTKRTIDEYSNDNKILYLSNNMTEVIAGGDTQKLLRLDENNIAKIPVIKFPNHFLMNNYEGDIERSVEIWRELGFNVPEHIFYYVNFEDKIRVDKTKKNSGDKPRLAITPDLSENNKYSITTYHPSIAMKLANAGHIINEYQEGFQKIKDIEANPTTYQLEAFGHVDMNGSKDKAIRHMFLVQIDKKNKTGKLYLGDVDHLLIYK